jgi:hypothetical protein
MDGSIDTTALTDFLSATNAGNNWEAIIPNAVTACTNALAGKTFSLL